MRRELAEWAQQAHGLSQRRAAGLIPIDRATLRYERHRDPQEALRVRLRELAGSRVRYGYRRLTVMLNREGWNVNAKRIYRLYTEEGLIVRTKRRKERAQRQRVANGPAVRLDQWAYLNAVHLDFIRPGRPVENGYIESFNGKLRDECLNVEVFFTLADARRKLAIWLDDYNHKRPHSALADRTPAEFAAICSGGNDGDKTALENAARFPHFPRTAAARSDLNYAPVSSLLLDIITRVTLTAIVPAKRAQTEPRRPKSPPSCG